MFNNNCPVVKQVKGKSKTMSHQMISELTGMHTERHYLELLNHIATTGKECIDRTGVGTLAIPHAQLSFDMSDGTLPIMTHKRMGLKSISAELYCFLHSITSKAEYNKHGTTIWNEWCNMTKIDKSLSGKDRHDAMAKEDDLGPIYGYQWSNFNGINQLKEVEDKLRDKSRHADRRMLVSAWNPGDMDKMALPPCHYSWQVNVIDETLHLNFTMRSVDTLLGMPYDIASMGILLALLADTHKLKRGKLTGMYSNVHVYKNHLDAIKTAYSRKDSLYEFPKLKFSKEYNSILDWYPTDNELLNYKSHERIIAPIAI